jgi:hypothetical protein
VKLWQRAADARAAASCQEARMSFSVITPILRIVDEARARAASISSASKSIGNDVEAYPQAPMDSVMNIIDRALGIPKWETRDDGAGCLRQQAHLL